MSIQRASKLDVVLWATIIAVIGLVLSTVLGSIATADLGKAEVACACTPAFGSEGVLYYAAIAGIVFVLSQILRRVHSPK